MKKNVKVIIMKAKATNGNDRTYRTIAPLDFTVADACKMRKISMLTILSATVTAPMTEAEAVTYVQNDMLKQFMNPNIMLVNCKTGIIAA